MKYITFKRKVEAVGLIPVYISEVKWGITDGRHRIKVFRKGVNKVVFVFPMTSWEYPFNPEVVKAIFQCRRSHLILTVSGRKTYYKYLRKERLRLWASNPRCYLCGIQLAWEKTTVDHLIPTSLGGTHSPENLRLSCIKCNRIKGAKISPRGFDPSQPLKFSTHEINRSRLELGQQVISRVSGVCLEKTGELLFETQT